MIPNQLTSNARSRSQGHPKIVKNAKFVMSLSVNLELWYSLAQSCMLSCSRVLLIRWPLSKVKVIGECLYFVYFDVFLRLLSKTNWAEMAIVLYHALSLTIQKAWNFNIYDLDLVRGRSLKKALVHIARWLWLIQTPGIH